MASSKIIYQKKPLKDGTISISIQIIHNRKAYPRMICRVPVADWDQKRMEVRTRHKDHIKINQLINRAEEDARNYILDCRLKKLHIDPVAYLKADITGNDVVSHLRAKMNAIEEPRTRIKYNTCVTRITEAGMNQSIYQINKEWVIKMDAYLKSIGNGPNTRYKYLSAIGSIFKAAKTNGLIGMNPFEGMKKNATPSSKAKLSIIEFNMLKTVNIPEPELDAIRKMFVFATLGRGIRAFDVLTLLKTDIVDDRLHYQAQKAAHGKEGKMFDIGLNEDMIACITDCPGEYLFPFVLWDKKKYVTHKHEYKKHVASVLTVINQKLKIIATFAGIRKNITMHVARHTFGYLADQAGLPLGTLQQMFGHGDLMTTKIYVESMRASEELDKAAERVFG